MYNLEREFFYCTPIFFHDVQNAKEINNKLLDNNFHYYDALVNTYSKLKREVDNNLN